MTAAGMRCWCTAVLYVHHVSGPAGQRLCCDSSSVDSLWHSRGHTAFPPWLQRSEIAFQRVFHGHPGRPRGLFGFTHCEYRTGVTGGTICHPRPLTYGYASTSYLTADAFCGRRIPRAHVAQRPMCTADGITVALRYISWDASWFWERRWATSSVAGTTSGFLLTIVCVHRCRHLPVSTYTGGQTHSCVS